MKRGVGLGVAVLAASALCATYAGSAGADEASLPPQPPIQSSPPLDPRSAPAVQDSVERPRILLTPRFEGGARLMRIYDIPIRGAEGTMALGFELRPPMAVYANLTVFDGVQKTGLDALYVRVGGDFEGRFDRLRLCAGINVGYLSLARATLNSGRNGALTLGAEARVSFDLVRWGEWENDAVFVDAKIAADSVAGAATNASPWIWGPALALGVRF